MCCDSAHKTLPTLTGGAYLHFGEKGKAFADGAKSALSLFASTSPSYLILRSLDATNEYIAKHIPDFEKTAQRVKKLKNELEEFGIITVGSEPFKACVDLIKSGIMTEDLAYVLDKNGIECEFADNEFAVFMLSVCTSESDIKRIRNAILSVDKKERKPLASFPFERPERVMSVRDAVLADSEKISVSMALNRVCASPSVSCPPAIPIVVSGERISAQSIALFNRYNAKEIEVVKD
jgi:arginine/lysine/ornithine decarboxylase